MTVFEYAPAPESRAIVDLRLCKDEHELGAMRRAAETGVAAHRAAMRACRPGANESDIAAAWWQALAARQSAPSFTPIISVHGEILHSERYVVLNSGHTFHAADFRATNAMLFPRLGDHAVLKLAGTDKDPLAVEVATAGLFDEYWK